LETTISKKMKKTVFIIFSLLLSTFTLHAQTWEFVGLDSLLIFHLYVEGDTIYAGTWDKNNNLNSGLYYSSDVGANWSRLDNSLGEGAILGLERNIDNTMYIIKCPCQAGNVGALYKTMNNGQSWELINNISSLGIRWFGISPFNRNEMYAIDASSVAGGIWSILYRTTDSGVNWDNLGPFPSSSHGSELAFAFDLTDSMSLYVTVDTQFDQYLFKSIDKGNNWSFVSTPPIGYGSEIYTDSFLSDRIYIYALPQYLSNNGGIGWFRSDSGLAKNSYYTSFYQDDSTPGNLYNLRSDGLFSSKRDPVFWEKIEGSENLPLDLPPELKYLKNIIVDETVNKLYLGTSDGLFRKDILTNILEEKNLDIEEFMLEQNYPNPFNPSTTISYHVPETSFITLKVYDILGNEIATLVNEEKPAGSYEVEFQSAIGSWQLTSGMYFYQLKVGNYVETKKMLLLK